MELFQFKPANHAQGVIICNRCFGIVTARQGNIMNLYLQCHHKIQYELEVKGKRNHIEESQPPDKRLLSSNPALYQRLCVLKPCVDRTFFDLCAKLFFLNLFIFGEKMKIMCEICGNCQGEKS